MPRTPSQGIVIRQLQARGTWIRLGPGLQGGQRAVLMRSATEEVEVVDIRVFRSLVAAGYIRKAGEIHHRAWKLPRLRYELRSKYRAQDHD